ncbi:MAG: outer membrane lipoprotein carrier protein LolA [Methylococcales bacterium]
MIRCEKLFIIVCFLPAIAHSAENLETVMARMAAHRAIKTSYNETRYLDLLDKPWSGAGFFYAKPPSQLVKLQLSPERVVMAADEKKLWYYDAKHGVHFDGKISQDDPITMGVASFQALINGDVKRLQTLYRLQFSTGNGYWSLLLLPKPESKSMKLPQMEVSGREGKAAQKIVVQQLDNADHSEYLLGESTEGSQPDSEISALIREAKGYD